MKKPQKFEETARQIRKLGVILFLFFGAIAGIVLYLMVDPTLSAFRPRPKVELSETPIPDVEEDNDFDTIENGVHLRTGFVEGEGLMTVVNNCTNCHSAKLVTQNRMTREGWQATIQWMQETQNLWDLGKNEAIIVEYLATYYAPQKKGRRENLSPIEWYELQ